MSIQKEQIMDMYFKKLVHYGTYADCLARVLKEFIDNGDSNLKPTDVAYLTYLLANYTNMLHSRILTMKKVWEFDK